MALVMMPRASVRTAEIRREEIDMSTLARKAIDTLLNQEPNYASARAHSSR